MEILVQVKSTSFLTEYPPVLEKDPKKIQRKDLEKVLLEDDATVKVEFKAMKQLLKSTSTFLNGNIFSQNHSKYWTYWYSKQIGSIADWIKIWDDGTKMTEIKRVFVKM